MQLVAGLHRANARWRAGVDEVARLERVILGEVGDLLRYRPDHVAEIGALALLAVDREPNRAARRMADPGGRHQRAAGRALVEILAEVPRPAVVLAPLLQVAPRHIEPDRIPEYVIVRALGVDTPPALGEGHHQLGLIVVIRGLRRIVDIAAAGDQRVSALNEEERLLAPVAAHLFLVLGVVASDAEDAPDRKAVGGARDRQRRRDP